MDETTYSVGAIAVMGHPANGVTARCVGDYWVYTHNPDIAVDRDDYRAMKIIYNPGDHA